MDGVCAEDFSSFKNLLFDATIQVLDTQTNEVVTATDLTPTWGGAAWNFTLIRLALLPHVSFHIGGLAHVPSAAWCISTSLRSITAS